MEFYEHLKSYLSDEEIDKLKDSLSKNDKHAVLLNTRKMDEEKFLSLFPHVIKHPIVENAYLYDKDEYPLGKNLYHDLGCYYLQEPSAMLPSYLLHPQKGETVLDLCAAPGGKSVQASFLMDNKGVIISNDLARNRCSLILENVERLGIGNVIITNNDFAKIYKNYLNYFDRIILDVPCSGSGMFRKDDRMIDDWSYNKVIKFSEIQKELILYAYNMLKEGGTMVYSTCSFSKEEDEDVIRFLLKQSDAEILDLPKSEMFYINKNEPLGIHTLPYLFPGEGHYICLIKKPGALKEEKSPNNFKKNIKYGYGIDDYFPHIYKFGDTLFGLQKECKITGLNIIRQGVKIGELGRDFLKYDYHFSHFIKDFTPTFLLQNTELVKYFSGEAINIKASKGYVLLTYEKIPVDITKSDGNIIKNHLPKVLRKPVRNNHN
ncbi:MAG: NOL1/NOP2/sun family putative RNA methylase [Bacilli bacterium]|nr:NOL1/NOP2/sun family putative RNA methylase [Bacilli bacterium]